MAASEARDGVTPTEWLASRHWAFVSLAGAVAFGLGIAGFQQHAVSHGQSFGLLGLCYRALQLFVLESGAVEPPVPPALEVARWLAPLTAAFAAAAAVAALLRDRVRWWRAARARDHVLILGLGRKGRLLARGFLRRGERVVGVDLAPPEVHEPLRARWLAVRGDCTEPGVLRRLPVTRARRVVVVTGDDGRNADTAVAVARQAGSRGDHALVCHAHVTDPVLCRLLVETQVEQPVAPGVRLEFFSSYDLGARILLDEAAMHLAGGGLRHLVVVGCGRFGGSIVRHAVRRHYHGAGQDEPPLQVTLIDRSADAFAALVRSTWRGLERWCDLATVATELTPAGLDAAWRREWEAPGTLIAVCLSDAGQSVALGLAIRRAGPGAVVMARTSGETGLARLVDLDRGGHGMPIPFDLTGRACRPELVMAGVHEALARALHEQYLRDHPVTAGQAPSPAQQPWDMLPDEWREQNRQAADHVGTKLHALGASLAPINALDETNDPLAPAEVEHLARLEHERWLAARREAGWRPTTGPRDDERRLSPLLVSWDQLPDDVRESNREAIRALPQALAQAGFRIIRAGAREETG